MGIWPADSAEKRQVIHRKHKSAVSTRRRSAVDGNVATPGKSVGAIIAAANVLRTLHSAERPLRASEVAHASGLYRGTAYNVLRTLQAEGFVGYDDATRTYAISIYILEFAHGVVQRSGLLNIARPLMQTLADKYGVSVYLSKITGHSSLLLLDWVGTAFRNDGYIMVGRQYSGAAGASGVVMAAFGAHLKPDLETLLAQVKWYRKPSFSEFSARVKKAKQSGLAIDRGTMFRDVTQVSVPVFSPSWEPVLILTVAGRSHDLCEDTLSQLSRAMRSMAGRLSENFGLLRLE